MTLGVALPCSHCIFLVHDPLKARFVGGVQKPTSGSAHVARIRCRSRFGNPDEANPAMPP